VCERERETERQREIERDRKRKAIEQQGGKERDTKTN
jgi:hypothetical protein